MRKVDAVCRHEAVEARVDALLADLGERDRLAGLTALNRYGGMALVAAGGLFVARDAPRDLGNA